MRGEPATVRPMCSCVLEVSLGERVRTEKVEQRYSK